MFARLSRSARTPSGTKFVFAALSTITTEHYQFSGDHYPLDLPDAELARRYTQGDSISRLSLFYGCSPTTVAKRLRVQGVAMRATRYRPINVPRDEFERLYLRERLPLRKIAARLGISPSSVGSKRRAFGIPARSTRGRRLKAVELQLRLAARLPLWHALRA